VENNEEMLTVLCVITYLEEYCLLFLILLHRSSRNHCSFGMKIVDVSTIRGK